MSNDNTAHWILLNPKGWSEEQCSEAIGRATKHLERLDPDCDHDIVSCSEVWRDYKPELPPGQDAWNGTKQMDKERWKQWPDYVLQSTHPWDSEAPLFDGAIVPGASVGRATAELVQGFIAKDSWAGEPRDVLVMAGSLVGFATGTERIEGGSWKQYAALTYEQAGGQGSNDGTDPTKPGKATNIQHFIDTCMSTLSLCEEVAAIDNMAARSFAYSIEEKVEGMLESAEARGSYTARMLTAVENMSGGLERWLG